MRCVDRVRYFGASLNEKEFQKYINRDGGCVHCGLARGPIVPHHRLNRGMGGSDERDVPSNIITMCSEMNYLMESNAKVAEQARENGWKLRSGSSPSATPVFFAYDNAWFYLDDKFHRVLKD